MVLLLTWFFFLPFGIEIPGWCPVGDGCDSRPGWLFSLG